MSVARPRLAVFCRAPRPGLTKTRLAPALGDVGAAAFSMALLLDVVARVRDPHWDLELWVPDERDRGPLAALNPGAPIRLQAGSDLGERMRACFAAGVDDGRPATVIIGSDCPEIDRSVVRDALACLADADAVICPGRDGGYGLIAARGAHPALFTGIAWGTDRVADATRAAAREAGLTLAEPCALDDVDRPADLARLDAELAVPVGPTSLGRTRAVLAADLS